MITGIGVFPWEGDSGALKLWCVIRSYGVTGIQEKIRLHINIAKNLAEKIKLEPDFEIMAPVVL